MSANDIFGGKSRWATYNTDYHLYTIVGGIPKDPDTIKGWLKAQLQLGETEIMAIADETIEAMGWTAGDLSSENLDQLVDIVASRDTKGNSFKKMVQMTSGWRPAKPGVDEGALVIEGRQIKAAIKEAANALYPGVSKWPNHPGDTRKGLSSYMVERLEVVDRYIPLGRSEPDKTMNAPNVSPLASPDIVGEQRIKHISGPQGKRSTINVVDLCEEVDVSWTIKVLDDFITDELWGQLWEYVELGGIGADRARGDGRGELIRFDKVVTKTATSRKK